MMIRGCHAIYLLRILKKKIRRSIQKVQLHKNRVNARPLSVLRSSVCVSLFIEQLCVPF